MYIGSCEIAKLKMQENMQLKGLFDPLKHK